MCSAKSAAKSAHESCRRVTLDSFSAQKPVSPLKRRSLGSQLIALAQIQNGRSTSRLQLGVHSA
jgi:hypothetical protein